MSQFFAFNEDLSLRQPETTAIMTWLRDIRFTASATLHGVSFQTIFISRLVYTIHLNSQVCPIWKFTLKESLSGFIYVKPWSVTGCPGGKFSLGWYGG